MSGAKEIRGKIASVKSTQKITSAMEKVAASKMRKTQNLMAASKPYAERIRTVISHVAAATSEYSHIYMQEREVKRVGYIVVSTDRGLCGGLNTYVFKESIKAMKAWTDQEVEVDLCVVGGKAQTFFNSVGGNIIAAVRDLGDKPKAADLIGSVKVMLDAYESGKIDRLYIVANRFVNTMTQKPFVEQLIPLPKSEEKELQHHWDYIYEPEAREILDGLMVRYVEAQVYQGVVENNACEQASRMLAMKNATDNAGNLIDDLQLVYNRHRQAAITQEISEICGGAAAV